MKHLFMFECLMIWATLGGSCALGNGAECQQEKHPSDFTDLLQTKTQVLESDMLQTGFASNPECKRWCSGNKKLWTTKCKWKKCRGCDPCVKTTTSTTTSTSSTTSTKSYSLTKYPFVGCMADKYPLVMPSANERMVSLTRDGIEGCLDICKSKGYLFGGLTCPASKAGCRCYHGHADKSSYWGSPHHIRFNGPSTRCAKSSDSCNGRAQVDGYATGGAGIVAVYGLEELGPWATGTDGYIQKAFQQVQPAAVSAGSPSADCGSPAALPFSSLVNGATLVQTLGHEQERIVLAHKEKSVRAECKDFCEKIDVWAKSKQQCEDLDDEITCEGSYLHWGKSVIPCAWDAYSCAKANRDERATCTKKELKTACISSPPAPSPPPPLAGDIRVPTGTTYILDKSVEVERIIIEKSATLLFPDVAGLTLSTPSIVVMGTLQLGKEDCPLRAGGAGITLIGSKSADVGYVAHKGITVHKGGVLDMHGKPYAPTWTRLKSTAAAGQNYVELQQPVDWEVGQEVLVVTTVHIDERAQHQNEVRTITAVKGAGHRIDFDEPLTYSHYGGMEYAGEVGLLSRSIIIQGDEQSEAEFYGGHIMCMNGAICRLSYTKGFRMGQLNEMGRYPFHLHMMLDVAFKSYFKGLVVHNSFWRAFTIHGTSNTTLSKCVAFNITGSAVYLEDGIEEDNLIEYNLIAHVHPVKPHSAPWIDYDAKGKWITSEKERLLPTDLTPSGFYCLNPKNRWIGNSASGGFTGFAFPAVVRPVGASHKLYPDKVPQQNDLLEFDGNTAHSSGQHFKNGACIYVGATLRMADPPPAGDLKYYYEYYYWKFGATSYARGTMLFKNTKMWACRAGFKAWGFLDGIRPQIKLENTEFHDNMLAVAFFGHNSIEEAIFTAHTRNIGVFPSYAAAHAFQLYDTQFTTTFSNVIVHGYSGPADIGFYQFVVMTCCTPSGLLSVFNVTFPNTTWDKRFQFNPGFPISTTQFFPQSSNCQDVNGGISGVQGGAILGAGDNSLCLDGSCDSFQWWRLDDKCQMMFTKPSKGLTTVDSPGYWACPRKDSVFQQNRTVVTIIMAKSDQMKCTTKKYPFFPWTAFCVRYAIDDQLVKGTLYHFGREDRRMRTGWSNDSGGKRIVGSCCDIGWYLDADSGASPVLMILLDQMVMSGSGLVFATRYPSGAVITVEKCFGLGKDKVCTTLQKTTLKKTFLDSGTGSMIMLETSSSGITVYLKLVNEKNEYSQDSTGAHRLLATNDYFQARYIVRSSKAGPVTKLLPPENWLLG